MKSVYIKLGKSLPVPLKKPRTNEPMVDWFSLPFLIIYGMLCGATMKLADLMTEHGVRWFKGDKMLFGVLWGVFGALLVIHPANLANVILARIFSYFPRARIDYANHAIGAAIIILAFIIHDTTFNTIVFFSFLVLFLLLGGVRDYWGNTKKKGKQETAWKKLTEPAWHHLLIPLVYSLYIHEYMVFWVCAALQLAYNAVKYGFYHAGWSTTR